MNIVAHFFSFKYECFFNVKEAVLNLWFMVPIIEAGAVKIFENVSNEKLLVLGYVRGYCKPNCIFYKEILNNVLIIFQN